MSKYKVTGLNWKGRRIPAIHTDNWIHANSINLYQGTVWQRTHDHKWRVVHQVFN